MKAFPLTEARRLYAAAHEPKVMIEVEGGPFGRLAGGARTPALETLATWTVPNPRPPLAR